MSPSSNHPGSSLLIKSTTGVAGLGHDLINRVRNADAIAGTIILPCFVNAPGKRPCRHTLELKLLQPLPIPSIVSQFLISGDQGVFFAGSLFKHLQADCIKSAVNSVRVCCKRLVFNAV